jgi:hypothetical protein
MENIIIINGFKPQIEAVMAKYRALPDKEQDEAIVRENIENIRNILAELAEHFNQEEGKQNGN